MAGSSLSGVALGPRGAARHLPSGDQPQGQGSQCSWGIFSELIIFDICLLRADIYGLFPIAMDF